MSRNPILPPSTPNLDNGSRDKSPLGPSRAPVEPMFETDDDVLPDDDHPADGSDKPEPDQQ